MHRVFIAMTERFVLVPNLSCPPKVLVAVAVLLVALVSDAQAGRHHSVHVMHTRLTTVRPVTVRPVMASKRDRIDPHVLRALEAARREARADPVLLLAIAWQESRFDPRARNRLSSARGLLQFTTVTWLTVIRDYGARHGLGRYAAAIRTEPDGALVVKTPALRRRILALRNDPALEAIMAADRMTEERGSLEHELGRPVIAADLYILHLLGPTGARAFLGRLANTPNMPSVTAVGSVAGPNRGLFVRDGHRLSVSETYRDIQASLSEQVERHAAVFASAG